MKGLWRILILFLLPGMVLGGSSVIAFFRVGDSCLEPLAAAVLTAVLWSAAAAVSAQISACKKDLSGFYYPLILWAVTAFTGGVGLGRLAGLNGVWEGVLGVVISGAASGVLAQCFACGRTGRFSSWYFAVGVLSCGWFFIYLTDSRRLEWMETFFFYLGELLILLWALASPLTLWGSRRRRWSYRAAMILIAALSVKVSPVYTSLPWGKLGGEIFPEGLYQRSFVTAGGSCHVLMAPDDFYGIFTADNRLLAWSIGDEELLQAIPPLLSTLDTFKPEIKLVTTNFSVLAEVIKEFTDTAPEIQYMPRSMSWDLLGGGDFCGVFYQRNAPEKSEIDFSGRLDMLLITTLPDNQYSGAIRNFWYQQKALLKPDGVAAIASSALANAALYRMVNEDFTFSTFLPNAGGIWVFSERKLDFSPAVIDRNLKKLYGENVPSRTYAEVMNDVKYPAPPMPDKLQLGANSWWSSWQYMAGAALLLLFWKILRIFIERRSGMYECLNSVENGFSGMLLQLLVIHIYIAECGLMLLAAAMLPLSWALIFCRGRAGGIIGAAAAWIGLILTVAGWLPWWALLAVLLQNSLLTGEMQRLNNCVESLSKNQLRKRWCGAFYGMLSAAAVMLVCLVESVPLAVILAVIAALRLPMIWQSGKMRVY
ncbi:MAG: hypothetical protein E7056_06585 [Lentisphaerae bacterium]|nr:hypothetical protein [Lentisphaerota bacterium]